jgi:hypothetical protein
MYQILLSSYSELLGTHLRDEEDVSVTHIHISMEQQQQGRVGGYIFVAMSHILHRHNLEDQSRALCPHGMPCLTSIAAIAWTLRYKHPPSAFCTVSTLPHPHAATPTHDFSLNIYTYLKEGGAFYIAGILLVLIGIKIATTQ